MFRESPVNAIAERAQSLVPGPLKRIAEASKPYQSTAAFLAGFGYDSVTLRRIDQLVDNLVLLAYLLGLGLLLVIEHRIARGQMAIGWIQRRRRLIHLGLQFLFGGLYSAYVIYYFKSASLLKSLIFLGLLAALLVANEFLEHRLRATRLQLALYYFCVFSFLLYFIPVLTGWMGSPVFIVAGALALLLTGGLTALVYWEGSSKTRPPQGHARKPRRVAWQHVRSNAFIWGALFAVLGLFYLTNIIPPVPVSVVHSGVYHDIERAGDAYLLEYERPSWYAFWRDESAPFRPTKDAAMHVFSAIFAPRGMQLRVFHRWEYWHPKRKQWLETDHIPFTVTGGRDGGWRGFTRKKNYRPGRWRVTVELADGRALGHTAFKVREPVPEVVLDFATVHYE